MTDLLDLRLELARRPDVAAFGEAEHVLGIDLGSGAAEKCQEHEACRGKASSWECDHRRTLENTGGEAKHREAGNSAPSVVAHILLKGRRAC